MRVLVIWLLPLIMLLALATPAQALTCIAPADQFDAVDLVVQGRVVGRPARNLVELEVQTYYRGEGPARLVGTLQGIAPDKDIWMDDPELGKTYLIGFVEQSDGTLLHRPCDLFGPPVAALVDLDLLRKMGAGHPPADRPGQGGGFPVWPMLGAALLGLGWLLWSRHRRQRA